MKQKSKPLEFGKWDESFPYSEVFDKVRKNKAKREAPKPLHGPSPWQEGSISREEVKPKRFARLPLMPTTSPYHPRHGTTSSNKTPDTMRNVGSDLSFDHSTLHSQQDQTKASTLKGIGVPSEGSHSMASPSTNERSRPRQSTLRDETSGPTVVPKLGDWDDNDPTAGDGFTEVFDQVLKERQNVAGKDPTIRPEFSSSNGHHQPANRNSKVH